MYAILSHGGRQYRVSAGDRMVVDRLEAEVGSMVALEPVLLTGGDGETTLGKDLDGLRVAVTVVAHRRGEKLRIFKYKAKKRTRKAAGYRSDLTELRVEAILAKGAALPGAAAAKPSKPRARRSTGATTAESTSAQPAAPATAGAAASDPTATAKPRVSAGSAKAKAAPKRTTKASKSEKGSDGA